MRTYIIEVKDTPLPLNATSKASFWQYAKEVAKWREQFGWYGRANKVPRLERVGH